MTDKPRDELRELLADSTPSSNTHIIEGEFAPCSDEEFAAGLQAQGWRPAPYLRVEGGEVTEVNPS